MDHLFFYLIATVFLVLFCIIALGVWNTAKGGSGNCSQILMRSRVALQFFAVLAIIVALTWFGSAS